MPTIDFTAEGLKKLSAPPGERIEYRSSRHAGLTLRVSGPTAKYPAGRKIFSTLYRFGAEQQRDTYHPPYPELNLTDAIKYWRRTIAAVETGTNPAVVKRERRLATKPRQPDTVRQVEQRYRKEHLANLSANHYTNTTHLFDEYLLPSWGNRDIATITRDDARDLIQDVLDTGKRVTANRLQSAVSALFRWAVAELQCIASSPFDGLRRRHIEVARERHLDDAEIVIVWRGAERLEYPAGPYMRMLTALGQRRKESAKMRLVNIHADWVWEIPREDTKPGRTHRVTLPSIARAIIDDCRRAVADNIARECRETGRPLPETMPGLDFVFAGRYGGHFSSYSLAKRRVEAEIEKYCAENGLEVPQPWTFHDLRRSVATGMARLGISTETVSKVMNHAQPGITGRVYVRYRFDAEVRAALETWGRHLEKLLIPERSTHKTQHSVA